MARHRRLPAPAIAVHPETLTCLPRALVSVPPTALVHGSSACSRYWPSWPESSKSSLRLQMLLQSPSTAESRPVPTMPKSSPLAWSPDQHRPRTRARTRRGNQTVGMRFQGIAVPQGATITSAYVQFQVDEVSTDAASLNIAAEDTDNAATFTTATNNVSARPRTGATVIWTPSAWPTVDVAGPDQRTPNIASLVQAVINRPGWTSGNALAVIVSGSGARVAKAYEGSVGGAPALHIEYQAGSPTTPPVVNSFSPPSGFDGDVISITGNHFQGATGVSFNGAPASFSIVSDTQISATVPAGVSTGPISISNPIGTGTSGPHSRSRHPPPSGCPRTIPRSRRPSMPPRTGAQSSSPPVSIPSNC